ncbi:MAG TPA: hypothetical protein VK538_12480 [Solirubrobacteraceae bacterium]|nr:hypothetical protein [Solirubrobacteraceae bacterium]
MPSPGSGIANVQPPPAAAEPGNTRAMTHGAQSQLVEPLAAAIERETWDSNPHLDRQRHGGPGGGVCRYARARARVSLVYAWLDSRSDFDSGADEVFSDREKGETWAVFERLEKWERQCDAAEAHLAIAPLTRARLGMLTAEAFDLAKHWQEEGQPDA